MKNSGEVIHEMFLLGKIVEITLIEFPNVKPLQDRFDISGIHNEAILEALDTRSKYSLPFWDAMLLTQFNPDMFSVDVLKEAKYHNSIQHRISIKKNDLEKFNWYVNSEQNIGVNSRVVLKNNQQAHIPLLDFHIPNRWNNNKCVIAVLRELNVTGFLFETNKSYHFIGETFMTTEELIDFLARSLLFCPILDKNWISHQLIEKSCTIRLTAKNGLFPKLICKV